MRRSAAGWHWPPASLGLEVEAVMAPYGEVERLVRGAGPALLRLPGDGRAALPRAARRGAAGGRPGARPHEYIRCGQLSSARRCAGTSKRRCWQKSTSCSTRPVCRRGAGAERGRPSCASNSVPTWIAGCWRLRLPRAPASGTRHAGAPAPRLLALVGVHTVQYLLWLLAWWVIGQGALQGRFDTGWLLAWALLLLTLVPCRLLATWSQGRLAIGAGGLLKQWLLSGALRLDPEETRHQGAGQLLGRVIESDAWNPSP